MKKRKAGQVIEPFKGLLFDTEIRFDKNTGVFSAELPPGNETIKDKTLDGVRAELRTFNKTYVTPGGWRRMLYVHFACDAFDPERDRRYGGGHNVGDFVRYQTQDMSLGFDVFEERENNPPGKRICRRYRSPEELADRRWGDSAEDPGKDQAWYLDKDEDTKILIMEWSEEREAALREIQKAIAALGSKLRTVLARPELVAGMLPMLTSGGEE